MANELQLQRIVVSTPDATGKRHFLMNWLATDFNTGTPTSVSSALQNALAPYGRFARVTYLAVDYRGSAAGVTASISLKSISNVAVTTRKQITASATDYLTWENQDIMLDTGPVGFASWFMNMAGYAATDDMYINIVGEVW